jgi:hypothetical protein
VPSCDCCSGCRCALLGWFSVARKSSTLTCSCTAPLAQVNHLDQILLNGNNIAVLVPGGKPEDS